MVSFDYDLLGAQSTVQKVNEKKEEQIKAQKYQANFGGVPQLLIEAEKIVRYPFESGSPQKDFPPSEVLNSNEERD